jgi:hypothetical protein
VKVLTKLPLIGIVLMAAMAVWIQPAAANTQERTVIHVDDTAVDRGTCDFRITFHYIGPFTVTDFYDNSGFLYKSFFVVGPGGPFRVTATAKGTTLTQQNSSFETTITYNPDGSINTITDTGPYNKFTVPGGGVVLLDAGRSVFDSDFDVVFEAGPHQAAHGDFDAFCAAFG